MIIILIMLDHNMIYLELNEQDAFDTILSDIFKI